MSDEIASWHYNHPDNITPRRLSPHTLKPDGRGQGMRVCTKCGRTEAEPDEPCAPRPAGGFHPPHTNTEAS